MFKINIGFAFILQPIFLRSVQRFAVGARLQFILIAFILNGLFYISLFCIYFYLYSISGLCREEFNAAGSQTIYNPLNFTSRLQITRSSEAARQSIVNISLFV